jgi:SAM-dependent methyltransferase
VSKSPLLVESITTTGSYSGEFFNKIEREGRASADVIVPLAINLFAPRSVVDVGCGPGEWLAAFERAGVDQIYGLDGHWVNRDRLAINPQFFEPIDLMGDWSIPGEFDLVVCLEVAEHIPKSSSARFVKQLVEAAPAILFSAALPGQEGTNHINEQWPEYWEGLFAKHDYVCLDPFRRHIWQDPRVAWYYQQNLLAYVDRTLVDTSPLLYAEFERREGCGLTLIHPKILRPMKQARPALKLLPALLSAGLRRRWDRFRKREAKPS